MIIVDPATIAIPTFAGTEDEASDLIDRVIHFSKMLSSNLPIDIIIDDEIEVKLGICCASLSSVREYLEMMNLQYVYDAKDIMRHIAAIQHKAARMHTVHMPRIEGWSSIDIDPPLLDSLYPVNLVNETRRTVLLTSLVRSLGRVAYMSAAMPRDSHITFNVTSSGVNCFLDEVWQELEYHKGDADAVADVSALANRSTAQALWNASNTSREICAAVLLGAIAESLESRGDLTEIRRFSIGTKFLYSLNINQALHGGRFASEVARTCSEIVSTTFNGHCALFGKPGTRVARACDGGTAYRCHITKGALGLRMMYWDMGTHIEFANIGPKFELIIEEGGGMNSEFYCNSEVIIREISKYLA